MFAVLMNGNKFAEFDNLEDAKAYAKMQQCKIIRGGLAKSPSDIPDLHKAYAAKQKWEVREV